MPERAPGPGSYFERLGPTTFRPSDHTRGAWSETEQHISPLNGLVVHALEQYAATRDPDDTRELSRISFDILGPVAVEELDVRVEPLRGGRSIELLEATATSRGREVLRARAWRLARYDTAAVAGGVPRRIPGPDSLPEWDMTSVWPGGYIASLDVRRSPDSHPGRATAWLTTPVTLLAGEEVSSVARFVALVDTANGICVRQPPEEWLFPNVDLTVHLHRRPAAGPVGLDTTVIFGSGGFGLTETVLHDVHGPVGRAAQTLTVRPRPGPRGDA